MGAAVADGALMRDSGEARMKRHSVSASQVAKAIKATDASREAISLDLNDPGRDHALEVWRADMAAENKAKADWRAQFPSSSPKTTSLPEADPQDGSLRLR
jgi:hypothetical protein